MTRARKPYTCRKKIRGRWRNFYRITWQENGKTRERYIQLPDNEDSPEYDRAYWSIRSGTNDALQPKKPKHTWRELATCYKSSPKFLKLAPSTRARYAKFIDAILEKNADKDVTKVTRAQIRAAHEKLSDTPRKADWYVQVVSLLMNFAELELEWPVKNPAKGIQLFGAQREFQPWPEWLQKAWINCCEKNGEYRALLAFYLGTGTGQRAGDLVKMEWEHFDGEFMSVIQEKTGTRLQIYCPAKLREVLAQTPRKGRFIFARNLTQPITYDMLSTDFRRVRTLLGPKAKEFTMHGWRYVAAVELAEAGCSDAEIQSVTGHRALQMVQKYRNAAQQKALSKAAQSKRERAAGS